LIGRGHRQPSISKFSRVNYRQPHPENVHEAPDSAASSPSASEALQQPRLELLGDVTQPLNASLLVEQNAVCDWNHTQVFSYELTLAVRLDIDPAEKKKSEPLEGSPFEKLVIIFARWRRQRSAER
jgi:hypothetical protein